MLSHHLSIIKQKMSFQCSAHIINPIGYIHSPYKEKFSIPRQPRLVSSLTAYIHLTEQYNNIDMVRGLEEFSHIWLLFLFDKHIEAGFKPTVRPPRLGGNQRIGVLATRSTFRPNAIGMSAVKLIAIHHKKNKQGQMQVSLEVTGADLLDKTPIVDIKPYLSYSDAIIDAQSGFASAPPKQYPVIFSESSQIFLAAYLKNGLSKEENLQQIIQEVLAQDPRPAYKKGKPDPKEYAIHLFDLNIKFKFTDNFIQVTQIAPF